MSQMKFKDFLLNEDKVYFGEKIGDILNSLHDLVENGKNMGARNLIKSSEEVVNQIRAILHSHWSKSEQKYLKRLQKVGVAIMRAIEERDDLGEILPGCAEEVEHISQKIGKPMNDLGVPEKEEEE